MEGASLGLLLRFSCLKYRHTVGISKRNKKNINFFRKDLRGMSTRITFGYQFEQEPNEKQDNTPGRANLHRPFFTCCYQHRLCFRSTFQRLVMNPTIHSDTLERTAYCDEGFELPVTIWIDYYLKYDSLGFFGYVVTDYCYELKGKTTTPIEVMRENVMELIRAEFSGNLTFEI